MNTLEFALYWASRGFCVFPLCKNSKVPATKNGFHDATTNEEQIRGWFTNSHFNIGIRTGRQSGFNIVDIDIKNGLDGYKSLERRFGKEFLLPDNSLLFKTASGGWHIPVKWSPDIDVSNGANVLGLDGVDLRGNGGYFVAAPSKRIIEGETKHYRVNNHELPITEHYGWITELLTDFKHSKSQTTFNPSLAMKGINQGSRNNTLFSYARHLFAKGLDLGLVMGFVLEAAHRCSPSLPESEARTIVQNAYQYNNQKQPVTPNIQSLKEIL